MLARAHSSTSFCRDDKASDRSSFVVRISGLDPAETGSFRGRDVWAPGFGIRYWEPSGIAVPSIADASSCVCAADLLPLMRPPQCASGLC